MTPNPLFGSSQADFRLDMSLSDHESNVEDNEEELYRNDSGIECEDLPAEIPDEQLIERIVHQVEALFSDENLVRDEFMAKHIRKNRGGFVNLKLVTSLRKVKIIAKDWRTVAHAIKVASSKLELNETGNKIRRKQALHPVDSGSKYDRTVFVINLPGFKDIDQLHRDFAVFGRISLIRAIRPCSTHPSHAKLLSHISKQVPSLKEDQPFGAVEFNRVADAQACLEQQHRLIAFDPVWAQVSLCIVKKSESSSSVPAKVPTKSIAHPELSKPTEDWMIAYKRQHTSRVHVPSPPSGQMCTLRVNKSPVIRQPLGPDGTRGFRLARHC